MNMETQIRQALARGYCHPENSNKELDVALIDAMIQEVVKTLTPDVQPGHSSCASTPSVDQIANIISDYYDEDASGRWWKCAEHVASMLTPVDRNGADEGILR